MEKTNSENKKIGTLIEVEYKYRANWINKEKFISKCRKFKPFEYLKVSGPDTYYENGEGKILRWRHNEDLDELTIKSRMSNSSSLVRQEIDMECTRTPVKDIIKFIEILNFKKLFRLYKDCEIFWFKGKTGTACIVYYTVHHKGRRDRSFIEIEAEKGQNLTIKQSKELVLEWEKKLKLKPEQRLNATLLEIYSDKKTSLFKSSTTQDY